MPKEFFKVVKTGKRYDKERGVFIVNVEYETGVKISQRTLKVAEAFGLGVDHSKRFRIYDNVELKITPRDIVYVTGDSGSGKSVLLRTLEKDIREAGFSCININEIKPIPDEPIIETVGKSFEEAIMLLSRVGLNDAFLFLRSYDQLSDGQKYRYRLAKLIESDAQFWIIDEFCSLLDRDTAKIVAYNVQKQARRMGKAVIAATTHKDLFEDLSPSVHIHKRFGREVSVKYYPNKPAKMCSLMKEIKIEPGSYEDWKKLAEFHYRSHNLGAVRKIFRAVRGEELCGIIVYSYPPPACVGRRLVLPKMPMKELNASLSTISRVVVHPKYRSIGLGVRLVKETLSKVGTDVEVTAVMARYNPFFEKAGMKKILVREPDANVKKAIEMLEQLGFKRYLLTSVHANIEKLKGMTQNEINTVKEALIKADNYKRLVASKKPFVSKKMFVEWLKNADLKSIAKTISNLAVLSQVKLYLFWKRP